MSERAPANGLLRDAFEHRYQGAGAKLFDFPKHRFPRNRYEAALSVLRPGTRVLDIGCGDGLLLYNLRDRFTELSGVDFARERAAAATAALQARGVRATVIAAALESGLPWPDGHFDAVVWTDVIQFAPDLFGAMREIARLTRPGGQIVTTAPNLAYLRRIASLLAGRFPATSVGDQGFAVREGGWYDDGTFHYFTVGSLVRLHEHAGFRVDRTIGHGRGGFVHALYPSLLAGGICVSATKRA